MKDSEHGRFTLAPVILVTGVLTVAACSVVFGDHTKTPAAGGVAHIVIAPKDIKWMNGPPGLPPGSKFAVLEGDPSKKGMFTMRGKMPAGYRIPAHWHPADERVTVLSGSLHIGEGDKLDVKKGKRVPAGGFMLMPATMHHFAWFDEETILQINGAGPWGITYINPKDTPTKVGHK